MTQRDSKAPPDEDRTSEEEAIDFDGTRTDQLSDDYRLSVVSASENSSGTVDHDDRGQARWKWVTEMGAPVDHSDDTFDHLKELENHALALDEPPVAKPNGQFGYDPYDTPAAAPKPKRK